MMVIGEIITPYINMSTASTHWRLTVEIKETFLHNGLCLSKSYSWPIKESHFEPV